MAILKDKISVELLTPFLIFDYILNNYPDNRTYDDRKTWQKVGYLAQSLGLPLNEYSFSWYIAGPYSPAFTTVLYNIFEDFEHIQKEAENYTLSEQSKKQLERLKYLVEKKPDNISISSWLELLASIHYIKNNFLMQNKENVFRKLIKEKSFFNNTLLNNTAWNLLKEANLV